MPMTAQGFADRIAVLLADLHQQGGRVASLVESAFESVFAGDHSRAASVEKLDDAIDTADVALERACVGLLTEAASAGASLGEEQLREVLTIAKINNELERIADAGVDVAELVGEPLCTPGGGGASAGGTGGAGGPCPDTFRVMANSVIGILRDTNLAVSRGDAALAKVVLQSQHAVTSFKAAILKDAEQRIAKGQMTVELAFRLHEVGSQCELIADHCTNIAEQVIYAKSGAIVRHMTHKWVELPIRG
jgi:phosphate transport system protein